MSSYLILLENFIVNQKMKILTIKCQWYSILFNYLEKIMNQLFAFVLVLSRPLIFQDVILWKFYFFQKKLSCFFILLIVQLHSNSLRCSFWNNFWTTVTLSLNSIHHPHVDLCLLHVLSSFWLSWAFVNPASLGCSGFHFPVHIFHSVVFLYPAMGLAHLHFLCITITIIFPCCSLWASFPNYTSE